MDTRVLAELRGGAMVWVEATAIATDKAMVSASAAKRADGEAEVLGDLSDALRLDAVSKVITGLAQLVHSGVEALKPSKTTAEFSNQCWPLRRREPGASWKRSVSAVASATRRTSSTYSSTPTTSTNSSSRRRGSAKRRRNGGQVSLKLQRDP